MDFKINEDFAKHYNEYRQKEELQKLKSRYGDVKISKKKKSNDDEHSSSEANTDSESSSSSSDSELEDEEHDDFLRLYDALCRNDPSLSDSDKFWFKSRSRENDESADLDTKVKTPKKSKERQVLLKDHTREFLISHGGIDDMRSAEEAKSISKLDALKKLKCADALEQKKSFLKETEGLFNSNDEDENILVSKKDAKFLPENQTKNFDISNLDFSFAGSKEDQDFLCDYLVNKRWKKRESTRESTKPRKIEFSTDAFAEQLSKSSAPNPHTATTELNTSSLDCIDDDEEFLVKARRFELRWNNNDKDLANEYPNTSAARFRFQEEDREFIKTYPRHIESTLRQPSQDKLSRAEKRQARQKRKEDEKREKLEAIQRLKRLKMAEFARKLEHIRKTCGEGVPLPKLAINSQNAVAETAELPLDDVADEMINNLETDWDPTEHDRLVQKLFSNSYYGAPNEDDDLDEPPTFSADEDDYEFPSTIGLDEGDYDDFETKGAPQMPEKHMNIAKSMALDHSQSSAISRAAKDLQDTLTPRRRGKRSHARSKFRQALEKQKPSFNAAVNEDFEKYFDEFYQLDCEDIISGSGPGDDIHCRFKYREVEPNDFGLTVDEILAANEKELNKWVSVKMMSIYRTDEEEARDVRKYHSFRMQQKKPLLIPSIINRTESEERPPYESVPDRLDPLVPNSTASGENSTSKPSKKALKRLRKKERKSQLAQLVVSSNAEPLETGPFSTEISNQLPLSDSGSVRNEADPPKLPTSPSSEQLTEFQNIYSKKRGKRLASDVEQDGDRIRLEKHGKISGPEPSNIPISPPHKKHKHSSKPKLSDDRLRAAGIDPRRFRYIKTK